MNINMSYILQYPSDILYITTEYSKKEEELQKEINNLSEILRNKRKELSKIQKELSKIQKENTLSILPFCDKNFDLGRIIFNSTTGNIYTVVNNYPLDIEEIKISNSFLED